MANAFQYDRLDDQKNQIRLLRVHENPQTESQPIRCHIDTFVHTQCPPYIAVSYRWGDAFRMKRILLNGGIYEIPESIWQFLLVLQDPDSGPTGWLWIDSICINQRTTSEKSIQVAKMGEIYTRAKEVWIWLGQPAAMTNPAIDFITNEELRVPTAGQAEGLEELFNRSFWKRIWIVQEILLATELNVFCGHVSIPWRAFISTVGRLMEADTNEYSAALMGTHAIRIIQAKAHWSKEKSQGRAGLPLLRLLQIYSRFEASDQRDKIYGLLALSLSHCTYPDLGGDASEGLQRIWEEQIRFPVSYRTQPIELFGSAFTSIVQYSIHYERQTWRNAWGRWLVEFLLDLLGLPKREDIGQLAFTSADQFLSAVLNLFGTTSMLQVTEPPQSAPLHYAAEPTPLIPPLRSLPTMPVPSDKYILIVTGPAGCGKSTVAKFLVERSGFHYFEGDDFRPVANIDQTAAQIPLTDADRWDLLVLLREQALVALEKGANGVVVACNALEKKYRDVIRIARFSNAGINANVHFVYLRANRETLLARAGHLIEHSTVMSQLAALEEPDEDEVNRLKDIEIIDVTGTRSEVRTIANAALDRILSTAGRGGSA